jgi:predicted TIM-barrel fold metal-dependent hydrolase
MIIDFHVHYLDEPDYLERLLETHLRLGIDKMCLSGLGELFKMKGNESVEEAFKKYPERIVGFAFVRLGEDTPGKIEEFYRRGFKGLKITMPPADYDDEAFFPLYEKAEELGMPLLFHCGIIAPVAVYSPNISSNWMRPVLLERIARTFSGLKLICGHLGVPWFEEAATLARIVPNIYLDITGSYTGWRAVKGVNFFRETLWFQGAWRKVVFGSDVPYNELHLVLERDRKLLEALSLTAGETAGYFADNAVSLLIRENAG